MRREQNQTKKGKSIFLTATIWIAVCWVVIALAALAGATYAWFTFSPYTKVEPMGSTVSSGETALFISDRPDQGFDVYCPMPPKADGDLEPISTSDLNRFYCATMQDRQGITTANKDITAELDRKAITGTLYLKSLKDDCAVYLYRPNLKIDTDGQTLAALRLGLRFTTASGVTTHIFALNNMGNTSGAEVRQTVPAAGTVMSGVGANGAVPYVSDPCKELAPYLALPNGEYKVTPGADRLFTIGANEVVTVEYWLYLEGCDVNCFNPVQNKNVDFQLSFAGVSPEE